MISRARIDSVKLKLIKDCKKCNGRECQTCLSKGSIIEKYAEANIPVDYWMRTMKGNFHGDEKFGAKISGYLDGLAEMYANGRSICLQGQVGTGKTMASSCILKKGIHEGFSAYYITMNEMLDELRNIDIKRTIRNVDFLVIDELDSRFFSSELSKELTGATFESIFRSRCQNRLVTILCTNDVDLNALFKNMFAQTFDSLSKQFLDIIVVRGVDYRQNGKDI